MPAGVLGLAHHLPAARSVGGFQRPIASEPGGASDLALPAARQALERAGASVAGVDFIVFATMTADVTFPGSAVYLQDKLGCATVGSLDLRGQCCGFLMGLMAAESYIASGVYRRVLLAASEVHSSGMDYSERGLAVSSLYGDAAAAMLLGPQESGVEAVVCHTDGRLHDRFWCEYPASRQHPVRITPEDFRLGRHFITIDTETVRTFGREKLPEVVNEALARCATAAEGMDLVVLSHVFPEVADDAALSLGVPPSRSMNAGERHGHLTAASLPLALSEAIEEGRIGSGARVCLAACGAGFTWGAAVLSL
jgi:3-oxoacyl-[acyl-carrier-protein] synthase III